MTIDRSKFRIGWELETETVAGVTKEKVFAERPANMPLPALTESQRLDIERYVRDSMLCWTTYDRNTLVATHWSSKFMRKLYALCPREHILWTLLGLPTSDALRCTSSLNDFLNIARNIDWHIGRWMWMASNCPVDKEGLHPELMELLRNEARQHMFGSSSTYILTPSGMKAYLRDIHGLPDDYTIENDATVSGIEFKPSGPLAPDESLASYARLRKIFAETPSMEPWTVSNRCSFHIHVSVADMKHNYGPNMQAFMYLYLLQNIHRVPSRVLERWVHAGNNGDDGDRYFKMNLGGSTIPSRENRYSFVAFRHEFKTWEFRCWGNIETVEDAKACVDLSLDAYNYAFDLVHKQKRAAPLKEIDTFSQCLVEFANSYLMYPPTGT